MIIYHFFSCFLQKNAGINPTTMRGSKTGVYIGVSGSEAGEAFSRDPEELLGYSMTGCQRAMFANRISYFFDFNGTVWRQSVQCPLFCIGIKWFQQQLLVIMTV